ncbi:MAG: hypothetical protein HOE90_16020 [Bacteriovoracaceae bacterium]|nr:hypothetical protein [Bacteriovoracaceae bacterium]
MKIHLLRAFTSGLLLLVFISCGNSGQKNRDSGISRIVSLNEESGTPLILERQDQDCTSKDALNFIGEQTVEVYLGGAKENYVSKNIDHSILRGLPSLNSPAIWKTTWGAYYREKNGIGGHSFTITRPEKNLIFCKTKQTYSLQSIESAGLSATIGIDQAHQLHLSASSNKLSKVHLSILPYYQEIVTERSEKQSDVLISSSRIYTDNAFYHHGQKGIYYLPQSVEAIADRNPMPFWKMPFVGAHEYGHHILKSYAHPHHSVIDKLLMEQKGCFKSPINSSKKAISLTNFNLETNNYITSVALKAFHEGFADLVAHYAFGSTGGPKMDAIGCMNKTRNANSRYFNDSKEKYLSEHELDIYFGVTESGRTRGCETNYSDSHHIGAIIAYGVNQLFSTQTSDYKEKAKLLFKWAAELRPLVSSNPNYTKENASTYFTYLAINKALKVMGISAVDSINNPKECKVLKNVFPFMTSASSNYSLCQ